MKEQLFITFLTHLLKQHENEELTVELSDRLVQAAYIHAKAANITFHAERQPYQSK